MDEGLSKMLDNAVKKVKDLLSAYYRCIVIADKIIIDGDSGENWKEAYKRQRKLLDDVKSSIKK